MEQRTISWYRARLGKITGSQVGKIMGKGRSKDAVFSQTAISYFWQLVAERELSDSVLNNDAEFEQYVYRVSAESREMRWGTEQEPIAREIYKAIKENEGCNYDIHEVGSMALEELEGANFASSPDGYVRDIDNLDNCGVIEIKCPSPYTYALYRHSIHNAEELKSEKPDYYYQCLSHMLVTGAKWCDFIAYDPSNASPIHIVRVSAVEVTDDMQQLTERILLASKEIDKMMQQ